jgi:hypothetical protein
MNRAEGVNYDMKPAEPACAELTFQYNQSQSPARTASNETDLLIILDSIPVFSVCFHSFLALAIGFEFFPRLFVEV